MITTEEDLLIPQEQDQIEEYKDILKSGECAFLESFEETSDASPLNLNP
jgi:hypothetical protein